MYSLNFLLLWSWRYLVKYGKICVLAEGTLKLILEFTLGGGSYLHWRVQLQKLCTLGMTERVLYLILYNIRQHSHCCDVLEKEKVKQQKGWGTWLLVYIRVILIEKSFRYPILHVPKLIPLLHWFQNSFCFRSRTFPSHGGNFFGTMVDLEGENGPKKPNIKIGLKPTQKC